MTQKFQQGGQVQNDVMQFVQGLAQVLQADPQQVAQLAQAHQEEFAQAYQVFQQTNDIQQAAQTFVQGVQNKTQSARHGAKLQYLKSLKHQCAEDEEVVYFKKGGSVGCGCKKKKMAEGGKTSKKKSAVDNFKNRKQDQATKDSIAVNRDENYDIENSRPGKWVENKKYNSKDPNSRTHIWVPDRTKAPYKKEDGGKVNKNCGGASVVAKFKAKCGAKMKKHQQGGSLNGIPFIRKGK